jgi:hypothetical protein
VTRDLARLVVFPGLLLVVFLGAAWLFVCAAFAHAQRGWQNRQKPPLADLSDDELRPTEAPKRRRRWPGPDPDQHQEELATPERCRAYARLAEEVARLRTVQGEMALFLASGLLGATLPHYFDRNHWWQIGAVGGVTSLVGAGLKLRSLARSWQRRAAFYYQQASSHDGRPADGIPATASPP